MNPSTNTLERLDFLRYRRERDEIERLLSGNPDARVLPVAFKCALQDEMEMFHTLKPVVDIQVAEKILREYLNQFRIDRDVYTDEAIEALFHPIYCAEALDDTLKTKLILSKLDSLESLVKKGYFELMKNQPYRVRVYVEVYLAKQLDEARNEDPAISLRKFELLLEVILKYSLSTVFAPNSPYAKLHKSDKSILFIVIWRILTLMDKQYVGLDLFLRRIRFLLTFCNDRFFQFFDDMKKVLILYSLNQSIVPLLKIQAIPTMQTTCMSFFTSLKSYVHFFVGNVNPTVVKIDSVPDFGTWRQFAFLNFLLMYHLISKRTFKNLKYEESKLGKAPSLDDMNSKFHPFSIVNLNEIKKKIKSVAHDVKDHKFLAMLTAFLVENGQVRLTKTVLEESIMQPFDDHLIIKTLLCIIFYLEGDCFKCYQFIYQLLEKERTHEKNTYIITYIASLLCLKHLDKPQEALVFAKSNLDYLSKRKSISFPLKVDVLYASMAYCYESIASGNPFFVDRMEHYARAIEYFELSYQANSKNEEVLYHLGLLHASILNYDAAYKYVREALKCQPNHLNSFLLLVLLSTGMGDYKKAGLVLEELLLNYKHPLLLIFKAYLEIENLQASATRSFLNLTDDLVRTPTATKFEETHETQEAKEISQEVLTLFKIASGLILNSSPDQTDLPAVVSLAAKYEHQDMLDYQNLLLLGVEAFIRLKDYFLAENLLELSKMKNVQESEYLYYKGLISELTRNYDKAKEYYEAIKLKTSTFDKSYFRLGIINLTVEEKRDLLSAKKELEEAARYTENPEILYYLGKLYEEVGDGALANKYLLKSLEQSYYQPVLPYSVLPNDVILT